MRKVYSEKVKQVVLHIPPFLLPKSMQVLYYKVQQVGKNEVKLGNHTSHTFQLDMLLPVSSQKYGQLTRNTAAI